VTTIAKETSVTIAAPTDLPVMDTLPGIKLPAIETGNVCLRCLSSTVEFLYWFVKGRLNFSCREEIKFYNGMFSVTSDIA
jgi:hypothetical protein